MLLMKQMLHIIFRMTIFLVFIFYDFKKATNGGKGSYILLGNYNEYMNINSI